MTEIKNIFILLPQTLNPSDIEQESMVYDELLRPFTVLSNTVKEIFQYHGIQITATMTLGETRENPSTDSWKHITEKIRKNLVTNTTTALKNKKSQTCQNSQMNSLPLKLQEELVPIVGELSAQKNSHAGKKDYDFLVYPYYSQIQSVLTEVFRVLKPSGEVHWVVADAALYGVHIKTHKHTKIIMEMLGFSEVTINLIRKRGHRWVLSKREGAKEGLGEYHIVAYKS